MYIIDAHLDLAWNALQWNRNLQQSAYTIRTQESHLADAGRGRGTVAFPEMRKGNIALCFATLLARSTGRAKPNIDYLSPIQAYATAQGQLAYYHALNDTDDVHIIKNLKELNEHTTAWDDWDKDTSLPQPRIGLVVSMESADPILKPDQLSAWMEAGVRIIGPAHYGSGRYAGGTSTEHGLTPDGLVLLREMDHRRIILDLTHLSDKAFWQALETFDGVLIASHNNCRSLVPHQRQFDDEQIRVIVERYGVIGVAFDSWMLVPNWVRGGKENPHVTLEHVADQIDHICQLASDSRHVAIGSDLDGGFGREQSPSDLDTIADLQKLIPRLAHRGYTEEDISSIMHGNWLRLLRSAWALKENAG